MTIYTQFVGLQTVINEVILKEKIQNFYIAKLYINK